MDKGQKAEIKRQVIRVLGAAEAKTETTESEQAAQALAADAVTAWVASILGPSIRTTYGELCGVDGINAAMVAARPDSPVVRRFVSGGGIYRFSYDVFLRRITRDGAARIDALGLLGQVADAIERHECPEKVLSWSAESVVQAPAIYSTDEQGAETYRMSAQIAYVIPS